MRLLTNKKAAKVNSALNAFKRSISLLTKQATHKYSRPGTKTNASRRPTSDRSFVNISTERGHSQYAAKYTPNGQRAVSLMRGQLLGSMQPQPKLPSEREAVSKAFARWASRPSCDFFGRRNLYGQLHAIVWHLIVNGEAIVRFRAGSQLEIIDPLRIPIELKRGGIEVDSSGRITSYKIYPAGYGTDYQVRGTGEKVPASEIAHCILAAEGDELRGRPLFKNAVDLMAITSGMIENAARNSEAAAHILAFIKNKGLENYAGSQSNFDALAQLTANTETPADTTPDATDQRLGTLNVDNSGVIMQELPINTDIEAPKNNYPHPAVESMIRAITKNIAAGTNQSYHNLGDYSGVSYSAGQLSRIVENVLTGQYRRVLEAELLSPIFNHWLTSQANMLGLTPIQIDEILYPQHWQYSRTETPDPQKLAAAVATLINAGCDANKVLELYNLPQIAIDESN